MSKHQANITDNESVFLCSVRRTQNLDVYEVTAFVTGDFGGGTVTIQASPDNGTTKVTLKDVGGTVVSITEDDVYNIRLGFSGKLGEEIDIFATMAGATSPDVDIAAFDNA